jgi:hypothetical protein
MFVMIFLMEQEERQPSMSLRALSSSSCFLKCEVLFVGLGDRATHDLNDVSRVRTLYPYTSRVVACNATFTQNIRVFRSIFVGNQKSLRRQSIYIWSRIVTEDLAVELQGL